MSDDAGQYYSCGEPGIPRFAGFADGSESPSIGCAGEAATIRYVSDEPAQRDRVSAWCEQISGLLMEIEIKPDPPASSFKSAVVARSLRDLRLLKMNFTASQIVRKVSDGEGSGHFLIHVNFSGVVVVSSMGRLLTLNEGEAVVLDGAQPFTIHRQQTGSSYVVRIPRGRMPQLFLAETVVMRRLPGAAGSAHLFTAYLDAVLLRTVPASPRVDQLAYRHVSDLLALLLDPSDPATEETDSAGIVPDESRGLPGVRFQAARSYIVEYAHDQISIRQVADHLGITERHAQRLFENHGTTFTTFLNDIRLARAHALLCDRASDKLRIRSICFKTGFRDVSHFNRVFRVRYGCTPAEVRKTRDGGVTPL